MHGRSWSHELVAIAASIFIAAYAIDAAWKLLRPLVPVLFFAAIIVGFFRWQRR